MWSLPQLSRGGFFLCLGLRTRWLPLEAWYQCLHTALDVLEVALLPPWSPGRDRTEIYNTACSLLEEEEKKLRRRKKPLLEEEENKRKSSNLAPSLSFSRWFAFWWWLARKLPYRLRQWNKHINIDTLSGTLVLHVSYWWPQCTSGPVCQRLMKTTM